LLARIVRAIEVFEAERPDRRDRRYVLAGFCPVGRIAG
jgi:hypothetical protein